MRTGLSISWVDPRLALSCLLLQLHPVSSLFLSFPPLGQSIASPAPGSGEVAQAGWGAGGKPTWRLTAAFTNRSLGNAELCFYFLPNPKNSLYQFTFPRLSWQGKVPESNFFLKRKPTLHVYLLQTSAAYAMFWEAQSLALRKWEKNSGPKSSWNTCRVSVITSGNVP